MKSLKITFLFGVLSAFSIFSTVAFAFGDLSAGDAYIMATTEPNTYILDVRTGAEWRWVGHPGENKLGEGAALAGKVVNIAYKIDFGGNLVVNPWFIKEVKKFFNGNPDVKLILMCRSGGRSAEAAALLEEHGFYNVFNMLHGFEGDKDERGYRTVNGWVIDGLPYSYSGRGYPWCYVCED